MGAALALLTDKGGAQALGSHRAPAGVEAGSEPLGPAPSPGASWLTLNVPGDVALANSTSFFKDGELFLWDDEAHNTALGRRAMAANTSGSANIAVGADALGFNTTGLANTAVGDQALFFNTTGDDNTAVGWEALVFNSGDGNTAIGTFALANNESGFNNIAIGAAAGRGTRNGIGNIHIGAGGADTDNDTIRIGEDANRTFIAGIRGVRTGLDNAVAVLIDGNGQLGTINSSRRVKEDIRDMDGQSSGLLSLRPVTFRYKAEPASSDGRLHHGLIAEEVAEVLPELVAYAPDGQPETVLYHELVPMLLNELQRLDRRLAAQEATIRGLREELNFRAADARLSLANAN